MTVDGDKQEYAGGPSLTVVSLLNTKIFLNSVISDAHDGARFLTTYFKNNYLQISITKYQYMQILLKYFTQEIQNEYSILDSVNNEYVDIEIRKGMYGLKEAVVLVCNYVVET